MEKWIPFFQTLIWPACVVWAAYFFRSPLRGVLASLEARIVSGDPIEISREGIKLGSGRSEQQAITAPANVKKDAESEQLPHKIYLNHHSRRDSRLDEKGKEYFRIAIWVEADDAGVFAQISSVTYHLHPTFHNPTRVIELAENEPTLCRNDAGFGFRTKARGQFNMFAEIKFKNQNPTLHIERYINF